MVAAFKAQVEAENESDSEETGEIESSGDAVLLSSRSQVVDVTGSHEDDFEE